MKEYEDVQSLTRAWLMVQAFDDVFAIAEQIYGLNGQLMWPKQHVVRADIVEGGKDFNIMVPVWAEVPEGIEEIAAMIRQLGAGVMIAWAQPGPEGHRPYPPHKAWGLVPGEEANPEARPMGFNAWG